MSNAPTPPPYTGFGRPQNRGVGSPSGPPTAPIPGQGGPGAQQHRGWRESFSEGFQNGRQRVADRYRNRANQRANQQIGRPKRIGAVKQLAFAGLLATGVMAGLATAGVAGLALPFTQAATTTAGIQWAVASLGSLAATFIGARAIEARREAKAARAQARNDLIDQNRRLQQERDDLAQQLEQEKSAARAPQRPLTLDEQMDLPPTSPFAQGMEGVEYSDGRPDDEIMAKNFARESRDYAVLVADEQLKLEKTWTAIEQARTQNDKAEEQRLMVELDSRSNRLQKLKTNQMRARESAIAWAPKELIESWKSTEIQDRFARWQQDVEKFGDLTPKQQQKRRDAARSDLGAAKVAVANTKSALQSDGVLRNKYDEARITMVRNNGDQVDVLKQLGLDPQDAANARVAAAKTAAAIRGGVAPDATRIGNDARNQMRSVRMGLRAELGARADGKKDVVVTRGEMRQALAGRLGDTIGEAMARNGALQFNGDENNPGVTKSSEKALRQQLQTVLGKSVDAQPAIDRVVESAKQFRLSPQGLNQAGLNQSGQGQILTGP